VFITLCHPSSLRVAQKGAVFRMEQGVLTGEACGKASGVSTENVEN
jgi:hypothetical protein